MRKVFRIVITPLLSLTSFAQLHAHHGSAPHFDSDDIVVFEGVVTEFRFVNPHAWVHFQASDAGGSVTEWRCELSGASQLRRFGWSRDTLVAGDEIRISGARAWREAGSCDTQSIHLADGTNLSRGNRVPGTIELSRVASDAVADARPRYLPNGQPNISGGWIVRGDAAWLHRLPVPTQAGLQAAEESYDIRFDDPVIRCESGNVVWDWARQAHVNDIRQQEDRVILRYGYLDLTRTIHLNVTAHPENLAARLEGHSIGRWEDDTLIVNTIGFLPRVLIPRESIVTSELLRITERFNYDEESGVLIRDFVATDPLYLAEPYVGRDVADVSTAPYQRYDCVDLSGENNRLPD